MAGPRLGRPITGNHRQRRGRPAEARSALCQSRFVPRTVCASIRAAFTLTRRQRRARPSRWLQATNRQQDVHVHALPAALFTAGLAWRTACTNLTVAAFKAPRRQPSERHAAGERTGMFSFPTASTATPDGDGEQRTTPTCSHSAAATNKPTTGPVPTSRTFRTSRATADVEQRRPVSRFRRPADDRSYKGY